MSLGVYTRIPNKYIKNSEFILAPIELLVLTLILMINNYKGDSAFNIKWLYNVLNISSTNTKRTRQIKETLKYFIEEGIFEFYSDVWQTNEIEDIYSVKCEDMLFIHSEEYFEEGKFTIIYDYEIKKIVNHSIEHKEDMFTLMKLYIYICSCINMDEKSENFLVCYPSHSTLSDEVGISEKTVLKYIDILKELNILVCDYAGFRVTSDGRVRNGVMYYARHMDEARLVARLKQVRKDEGYIKQSGDRRALSNRKRELKQRINVLSKKELEGSLTRLEYENKKMLKEAYNEIIANEYNGDYKMSIV